ncbi:unnamed protein product [Nesidiocoris tenuis]|uniref:Uncharacterized protein n=1 Tax=Nesidiocoris tenuis TaxID=355587 RepID=A0A6H5H7D4_9HEMI|nr:unnamed protein product [Nesidiocoris tenuis]
MQTSSELQKANDYIAELRAHSCPPKAPVGPIQRLLEQVSTYPGVGLFFQTRSVQLVRPGGWWHRLPFSSFKFQQMAPCAGTYQTQYEQLFLVNRNQHSLN